MRLRRLLVIISSSFFFLLLALPTMGADLSALSSPFGLVQKTVTIIGPTTPPSALQSAGHTYIEQGMILTAQSGEPDSTFASVTDSSSRL